MFVETWSKGPPGELARGTGVARRPGPGPRRGRASEPRGEPQAAQGRGDADTGELLGACLLEVAGAERDEGDAEGDAEDAGDGAGGGHGVALLLLRLERAQIVGVVAGLGQLAL